MTSCLSPFVRLIHLKRLCLDLALYLIIDNDDRHAVGEWFYITWLYEVALGITIGTLIGYTVRKVMKFSERKGLIDRQSFVAQYVSLAVLTIGKCLVVCSASGQDMPLIVARGVSRYLHASRK